jgi:glucose/mannose transport system permease protein
MSGGTADATRSITDQVAEVSLRRVGLYAVLVGLLAFYLSPIEAGLVTSLKTTAAFNETAPYVPPGPSGLTLAKWAEAFSLLQAGLVNSLILTIPATILSATLGSLAAYGLTKVDWKGQVGVYVLFIAGIFIPYQAVLVPLSEFWGQILPLYEIGQPVWAAVPFLQEYHGHLLALIVTHTAYGVPICTLLFRSYYKEISDEIIEAARLDGASVASIYRKVILPLSVPMFAVTLIYQFTQVWNDLLFALIIIPSGSGSAAPVTLALVQLGSGVVTDFTIKMAGALVTALPTIIVYVLFGEQFAEGVAT